MFGVTLRDHVMIAHSLRGEVFGPAQNLHGATYVVDVSFYAEELDADGIVVDIGQAAHVLHTILADLNYRNLDDHPAFSDQNSTTEVVARRIADLVSDRVEAGSLGADGKHLTKLVVRLQESPLASASYERAL